MKIPLNTNDKIAFVMSPRLGDSLLAMIIVHNLQRNGYDVTVFSNSLCALSQWFPEHRILPYPDKNTHREVFDSFDLLLHTYPPDILFAADRWHPRVIVLDEDPLYRRCISMVDLQVAVCDEMLRLSDIVKTNGLYAPIDLTPRRNNKRIIIHPTAFLKTKYWLPKRFVALAKELQQKGFEPIFVASAAEQAEIPWIAENNLNLRITTSLDNLARLLFEAGWFIGNDSGVGHLASNLGIPTVSLMQRRKGMIRWRPNWAPGKALLPWAPLIVRAWKERFWKYFISVSAVIKALEELMNDYPGVHGENRHELLPDNNRGAKHSFAYCREGEERSEVGPRFSPLTPPHRGCSAETADNYPVPTE